MDFMSKNNTYLQQNFPEVFASLEQLEAVDCFKQGRAKNGQPTLSICTAEGNEVQVHSKYNPGDEGKRFADAQDIENKKLVIVIGLGLGYHLLELVKRKKAYTQIVVIEKERALFKMFLAHVDYEELLKAGVTFVVGRTVEQTTEALNAYFWQLSTLKYAIVQFMPLTQHDVQGSTAFYHDLYNELKRQLNFYILNQNTIMWHSREMQEHVWDNMVETLTHHGVKELAGAGKGIPAIVIAAGPSLDKQIEWIRQAKPKALIICVDTALKTLLKAGIKPHIAVAVDYSQLNYEKIRDVDAEGYYMAVLPAVVPEFFEMFKEKTLMYYTNNQFYEWISKTLVEKGIVPAGGSVAHSAYQIAETMGCSPIIFTGLDLAYTGGITHSSGGMYDGDTVDDETLKKYVPVPSVTGDTVYTTQAMWGMILAFERMFAESKATIIDATEGGALIKGVTLLTFNEVFKQYLSDDQSVDTMLKSYLDKPVVYNRDAFVDTITETLEDFRSIATWATEGLLNADRIVKHMRKKGFDKIKVGRYMGIVRDMHGKIAEKQDFSEPINNVLLRLTRQHAMNKVLFEEDKEMNRKEIGAEMQELGTFFKGINEAADWFVQQIDASLNHIEAVLPK